MMTVGQKGWNDVELTLELMKRPEPRGEIDRWKRHSAQCDRIVGAFLANLEAAGHRVAGIDSDVQEKSGAGEMWRAH